MARGKIIGGRYELDPNSRRKGGMGEVWFGYDKRLDRPIAIKFIRVDRLPGGKLDDELTKRFVRESRITARLEHPGVPAVYDCGADGDDLYLVMQLIKGVALTDLIAEVEKPPVGWAAAIAAQVCSVLAVAHANSLVHRDLKPANLMLCPDGAVKVLDFGVAAALSPSATKLTATGVVIGTAEYMVHPVRMYAAVVGRVAVTDTKAPTEEARRPARRALGSEDIQRVRRDAGALKAESRFRQAAELLAEAVRSTKPTDEKAVELRIDLADVLFLGGDYRRAASEFRGLAADLASLRGEDDHLVLRFRLMEANCHAALGDAALALDQMRRLLTDEERFGVDEDRILELRRRIGLLELGAGDRDRAGRTLRDLLPDLERRYGSGHPNVIKVRELLDGLATAR